MGKNFGAMAGAINGSGPSPASPKIRRSDQPGAAASISGALLAGTLERKKTRAWPPTVAAAAATAPIATWRRDIPFGVIAASP